MAASYIAYLSKANTAPPILPQIVLDMLNASELPPAVHGQVVGFFAALETELTRNSG